jgi:UDP-glucose 4-epimerase
MNILITGGAGYNGSAAAKALLKAGHQVTVYDSLATGHGEAVPEGAIFIHADLCDLLTLGMALRDENYEAVMHFAAFIEAGESRNTPLSTFIHGGISIQRGSSHRRFAARTYQYIWIH